MRSLQTCVVSALETCREPTPANIIDSLFNFVRKMTPCNSKSDTKGKQGKLHSESSAATNSAVALVILFSLLTSITLH